MKKIVALVLSLVMALSLCTVAFAATNRVVYDLDGNNNVDKKVVIQNGGITLEKAESKDSANYKHIAYYHWVDGKKSVADEVECYVGVDTAGKDVWVPMYEVKDAVALDQKNADANWTEYFKVLDKYGVAHTGSWKLKNSTTSEDWLKNEKTIVTVTYTTPSYSVDNDLYGIPCTQDDADAAVYNNGKFENWIMIRETNDLAFYDVAATAQSATTKLPNCTTSQYLEDGYVDADGNYYVVDAYEGVYNTVALNVNGIIVFATNVTGDDDFFIPASHIFAKGVKNDKMGYDVATCLICKGEFACTNNEAVATKTGYKISNTFSYSSDDAERVYDANAYANGYDFAWGQAYASDYKFCWALKAGTTEEAGKTTDTDKKGVDSAKTFDAGIAMYVGMSLLSVAGSAVVIGKKKEF